MGSAEGWKFKGSLPGKVLPPLHVYYLLFLLQQLITLRALNVFSRLKLLLCFDTNFEEHWGLQCLFRFTMSL